MGLRGLGFGGLGCRGLGLRGVRLRGLGLRRLGFRSQQLQNYTAAVLTNGGVFVLKPVRTKSRQLCPENN